MNADIPADIVINPNLSERNSSPVSFTSSTGISEMNTAASTYGARHKILNLPCAQVGNG